MHTSSELTKPVNTLSMYIVHLRLFNSGSSLTFIMVGSEGPYISASSKPTLFDWKHIYMSHAIMLKKQIISLTIKRHRSHLKNTSTSSFAANPRARFTEKYISVNQLLLATTLFHYLLNMIHCMVCNNLFLWASLIQTGVVITIIR